MSSTQENMSIDDIFAEMDRARKVTKPIPMSVALPTVLVGVPVWLFGILPITVTYQLAKAMVQPLLPTESKKDSTEPVDKTIPSNVIPRSKRKYDVVVLGATGFTGKLAATHIARTYGVDGKKVKWAIAGRSASKLAQVKKDIADELKITDMDKLDTLLVDTSDLSTLPTLVKDTKCVITTAGPFEKYGSNVVEYCAKYGTHYVDITGEIEWVKTMILKWDDVAKQTGAILCPLCGHDSVPWDLTVHKLTQMLKNDKTKETVKSVTCLDDVKGEISGGTLDTMLMALDGKAAKAPKSDFDPLLKAPDGTKSAHRTTNASPALMIEKSDENTPGRYKSSWNIPFLMAEVNAGTVRRSNALHGSSSISYKEVQVLPDFKTAFVSMFGLVAGLTALLNPLTGMALKKMLPKPGQGPSRSSMERNYLCVTGQGLGSMGSRAETVMYFSSDAGYKETGRMVAESGLCLALGEKKLTAKQGGFWTPATAMGDLLLERLCLTGTLFASRMIAEEDGRLKSKL